MAKKLSSLSIFFPAYNEEFNIEKAVLQALEAAKRVTNNYEVIVVNDGSTDNTESVVQRLVEKNSHVRLINHACNQGYGAALMSGFINSTKGWIFFTDADLQFDINELTELIAKTDESDVVLGFRRERKDPFVRLINAKGWNVLNRLFFGLRVKDVDCAFKLIKASAIKPILHKVKSRGAMISAELLIRLQREGHKFAEVGVSHYPRKTGSPTGAKPSVIIRAFKEMAMVYRGDLGNDWVKGTVRFILIGGVNTVIDLATYFGLVNTLLFFSQHRIWAKGISYIFGAVNSFIWNRALSSDDGVKLPVLMIPSVSLWVGALAINTTTMYVAYESFHIGELPALFVATFITLSWNLSMSKIIGRKV